MIDSTVGRFPRWIGGFQGWKYLPTPTDVIENPCGKKTIFFRDATQKSASLVPRGIAIEVVPTWPMFSSSRKSMRKRGGADAFENDPSFNSLFRSKGSVQSQAGWKCQSYTTHYLYIFILPSAEGGKWVVLEYGVSKLVGVIVSDAKSRFSLNLKVTAYLCIIEVIHN